MRIFTCFSRRAWLGAAIAGVIASAIVWVVSGPACRQSFVFDYVPLNLCFNHDFRFVAEKKIDLVRTVVRRQTSLAGNINLWHVPSQRCLWSISHNEVHLAAADEDHAMAFDSDDSKFVVFAMGKARAYDVLSGKNVGATAPDLWRPNREHTTRLVCDHDGVLYLYLHDSISGEATVRDLWTTEVLTKWKSQSAVQAVVPGGIVEWANDARLLREIPSGKIKSTIVRKLIDPANLMPVHEFYTSTPDGQTFVDFSSGSLIINSNRTERQLDMPAGALPAISPDGKLLAVCVQQLHAYPNWMSNALRWIGVTRPDSLFVVYDLDTSATIATFPNANSAHFSRDGRSFALVTDRGIEFYDLPLRKPWWRIGGVGLAVGGVILGIAWLRKWRAGRKREPAKPVAATA